MPCRLWICPTCKKKPGRTIPDAKYAAGLTQTLLVTVLHHVVIQGRDEPGALPPQWTT
jgi:hypothetical protein